LIQLPPVGGILGGLGLFGGTELDKGIVALHVNADEFSVGRKEHFEVFTLGGLFVEVDNEEGFGGGNLFASFVFLAFDAAITTGKFGTKGFGDHVDIHSANISHVILDPLLLSHTAHVLEEHEAVAAFHIHTVQGDGAAGVSTLLATPSINHGPLKNPLHITSHAPVH
jgi:hypothetical protein